MGFDGRRKAPHGARRGHCPAPEPVLRDRRELPLRKQVVEPLGELGLPGAVLVGGQHPQLAVHGRGEVGSDEALPVARLRRGRSRRRLGRCRRLVGCGPRSVTAFGVTTVRASAQISAVVPRARRSSTPGRSRTRARSRMAACQPANSAATERLIANVVVPVPPFWAIRVGAYMSRTRCFEELLVESFGPQILELLDCPSILEFGALRRGARRGRSEPSSHRVAAR